MPWRARSSTSCRPLRLLGVLLLLSASAPAQSQQDVDRVENPAAVSSPTPGEQALTALSAAPVPGTGESGAPAPYLPKVWCDDIEDDETRTVCWRAYRASLAYYETGLEHRARVFRWQHTSTVVIFFIVLGLVTVGVYFAWRQFERDISSPSETTRKAETHTVEMSTSGVKVSSPVLGVIILALSLAFFYLYLIYVYPIHELF